MEKNVVLYFAKENALITLRCLIPKKKLKYGATVRKIAKIVFDDNEIIFFFVWIKSNTNFINIITNSWFLY